LRYPYLNLNKWRFNIVKTQSAYGMILGAQGNVWTEYIRTPQEVEYMIFPRLLALSEVLWTSKDKRDYNDFIKRLKVFENYFVENKINYAKHVFK
jgi:hexosaminidase